MAKYVVNMIDVETGDVREVLDDKVFDTEEAAQEYACECGGDFAEGEEVLSLAGEDYTPREEVDFVVEEIDD